MTNKNFSETFKVIDHNFKWLEEKVIVLNKRAKKLGCEPININILNTDYIEIEDHFVKRHVIEINGETPKFSGWNFLGIIEHGDNYNIFHCVPGKSIPEKFRHTSTKHCDHCGHKRKRKNTYVVSHEDGTTFQVGSSCLKDFLGHQNPTILARFVDELIEFIDNSSSFEKINGINYPHLYSVEHILHLTTCFVLEFGFMSKSKFKELDDKFHMEEIKTPPADPTVGHVIEFVFDHPSSTSFPVHKFFSRKEYIDYLKNTITSWTDTDEYKKLLNGAIEWLKGLEESEMNDYLYNSIALVNNKFLTQKEFGLAVSIIGSYYNKMKKEEEEKETYKDSEYVGNIKERRDFIVTVDFWKEFDGYYGTTTLYKMRDEDNNVIVWWCTNNTVLEKDKKVKIKATVKAHEEYNEVKQTVVNRAKILENFS